VLTISRELQLAVAAVRCAAAACQSIQATLVSAETLEKRDRSPVTVADFASQAIVCEALGQASSVAAIVGEEDAKALREDAAAPLRDRVVEHVGAALGRELDADSVLDWIDAGNFDPAGGDTYWTLDPIDGTKGFLRRGHYAVALALIDRGDVVAAALACPGWDTLLCASRGEGARELSLKVDAPMTGAAVHVAAATELRFCESVESAHSDQSRSARIAAALGITAPPLRIDSQAKYAAVARGDASIYLRMPTRPGYREKIWDHAGGALITTEAGGRVSDIHGTPLDFGRGRTLQADAGVVATNGAVHDQVIAAIARA